MNVTSVTAAIADLNIAGVTVLDIGGIPEAPVARDLPLLFPSPTDMFTAPAVRYTTAGDAPGNQAQVQTWQINYTLLYAEAGEGRKLADVMPGLVAAIVATINAVQTNKTLYADADIKRIAPVGSPSPAVIVGPAGKSYHGATLTWEVVQYA